MARKSKLKLRGIAQPVLPGEPLVLRLCTAFVDNLALLLRTMLVIGAVVLVQDLRTQVPDSPPAGAALEPAPAATVAAPPSAARAAPDTPLLSDRVKHCMNCTYQDYRAEHFDECVETPSSIYAPPPPDPDDTGMLEKGSALLLARVPQVAAGTVTGL